MTRPSPRRNRVDPFGDLHATPERGLFTGNRGCLVDDSGNTVRHHAGRLWIVCQLRYRGWRSPLDKPHHWTPLFFLDDAVALAAGHRPCGLCRRDAYRGYRDAVGRFLGVHVPPGADSLNGMLADERLGPGRGLDRAKDRLTWFADADSLPDGTVIVADDHAPMLLWEGTGYRFTFSGWVNIGRQPGGEVRVLTPQTSVGALQNGFTPLVHPSASAATD